MIASPANESWTSSDKGFAGAELAGKVMEMYKEAWHSLAFRLHSAYRHCAASYALAIPVLKFLWKELCGDCRRAMQAATGDYSIVVVGCETLVLLLVATVMCEYSFPLLAVVCACQLIGLPIGFYASAMVSCAMLC